MSALKFTCPSCGQHMQCEKAYVGHQIPCPSCGAQLRVPVSDAAGGGPDALPRAELVSPSDAPPLPSRKAPASDIPQEIVVEHETKTPPLFSEPKPAHDTHCICPVCQSELKVPAAAGHDGRIPVAELVHKAAEQHAEPAPTASSSAETSALERERQIAAARAAHPVEVSHTVKPRLSYVLSGGAAPTEAEKNPNGDTQSHAE